MAEKILSNNTIKPSRKYSTGIAGFVLIGTLTKKVFLKLKELDVSSSF